MIEKLIDRDTVYDSEALQTSLGVSSGSLSSARVDGTLRFAKIGIRVLFLGSWVIDWLERVAIPTLDDESGQAVEDQTGQPINEN